MVVYTFSQDAQSLKAKISRSVDGDRAPNIPGTEK
jgi:hypothetical protein